MQKDFKASRRINHALWLYVRLVSGLGHYSLTFSNMIRSKFKCSACVMERLFINHPLGVRLRTQKPSLLVVIVQPGPDTNAKRIASKHMLSIFDCGMEKFNFCHRPLHTSSSVENFISCNNRANEIVSWEEGRKKLHKKEFSLKRQSKWNVCVMVLTYIEIFFFLFP